MQFISRKRIELEVLSLVQLSVAPFFLSLEKKIVKDMEYCLYNSGGELGSSAPPEESALRARELFTEYNI